MATNGEAIAPDDAIEPRFETRASDSEVCVYRGEVQIRHEGATRPISGDGEITLKWRPIPHLAYRVSSDMPLAIPAPNEERVETPDGEKRKMLLNGSGAAIEARGVQVSGACTFSPVINDGVFRGMEGLVKEWMTSDAECVQVVFHVPNFVDYNGGRWVARRSRNLQSSSGAAIEDLTWRFRINSAPDIGDVTRSLRNEGGHGITHVGQLERVDGAPFSALLANEAIDALGHLLSFARGRWSMPLLRIGLNANGEDIWRDWTPRRISRWQGVRPWWTENVADIESMFCGFMKRKADTHWKPGLDVLVEWYVEASAEAATVETALVLIQAALEMMGGILLVDERSRFTRKVFEDMKAADKLRELLLECHVPPGIPAELTNLAAEAVGVWKKNDGPGALTFLRNKIVHGNGIERVLNAPLRARREAKLLGLWYLEMCLLRLFGFQGEYLSRWSSQNGSSQRLRVPWAQS